MLPLRLFWNIDKMRFAPPARMAKIVALPSDQEDAKDAGDKSDKTAATIEGVGQDLMSAFLSVTVTHSLSSA